MALRPSDNDDLNPSQSDYRQKVGDIAKAEKNGTFNAVPKPNGKNTGSSQEDANLERARDGENNPGIINNFTGAGTKNFRGKGFLKKRGPVLTIAIVLLLGGATGSIFMGGALAPLAFFESVTDDLNDQLAALDRRGMHIFRNKLSANQRSKAITGCSTLSIRCKLSTMSRTQLARYQSAGIDVIYRTNAIGRIVPDAFRFRGVTYTAAEVDQMFKNTRANPEFIKAYKRAINPKFLGFSDASFTGRTLTRFGLSKQPPELRGSAEDTYNMLANRTGTGEIEIESIKPVDPNDPHGEHYIEGDTSDNGQPRRYTRAQADELRSRVASVATAKPPSRITTNAVKGLSIIGWYDIACTVKNTIGAAGIAAKIGNSAQLAQYAMPPASLVGKLQAGEATPEEGEALGKFFMDPDTRNTVIDLANSFSMDNETGVSVVNGDLPLKENPSYGKNAMDSDLYRMSAFGYTANGSSPENISYSLGMGQNRLLSSVANFADVADIIVNMGTGGTACETVQHPLTRGAGLIIGVIIGAASFGTSTVVTAAISAALIGALIALDAIINNALSGSILEDMDQAPVERASATWTGMSVLMGESAKNRAMMPATSVDQILAYQQLQDEVQHEYAVIEAEDADPFDVYNQYSFLGSFVRSVNQYISPSTTLASSFQNVSSLVFGGIASAINPKAALAKSMDPARFEQCDDPEYEDLGIVTDVQCNVRYVMPADLLELDPDEVALYMETRGYVAPDTTTGLPPGYVPPEPEESQGFAEDMLNGIVGAFYEDRDYVNEYGQFLDYCVYRAMPFGETYQETTAFGAAHKGYINGEKCLERGTDVDYFRAYTFDLTVSAAMDDPIGEADSGVVDSGLVVSPVASGVNITSRFGPRVAPIAGASTWHLGLDYSGRGSRDVYAIASGQVADIRSTGNHDVSIRHGDGLVSIYKHMETADILVKVGDSVAAGQKIGTMGNAGTSTSTHLHFELDISGVNDPAVYSDYPKNSSGTRIDPYEFLKRQGVSGYG